MAETHTAAPHHAGTRRANLLVRVVTPEKTAYEHEAESVRFPGWDGLFGVLRNHAAMITPLSPGILTVHEIGGKTTEMFVSDGFAEVRDNVLRIVCEASERPEEIDLERAKESEQRARQRIHEHASVDVDLPRAEAALQRALYRQKLVRKYRA